MTLKELEIGKSAVVTQVGGEGALRQHFLDMGMIPGAEVTVVKFAPMGDPMELQIHGYELTLRLAEAEQIEIKPIDKRSNSHAGSERIQPSVHPGLGEEGKFHSKEDEHPLPEGTTLTYALVGNQNCGKTTLFNQLTGANQHVGNFPGVTVDRKDGAIKGYSDTNVTDLPGIYSMSPYSSEEIVSRNFVLQDHPTAIINIVDATNIERNLYLTMQLIEMDIPMVLALNMMDEIRNTDIHRTRRHAAGILAIQAAGRFERGFLDIITVAHLLEVGGPDFRILFAHGNARNFICHSCLLSLFCGRLRHSDAEHRSILVCRKRPVVCGSVVICRARHGICDRSRAPARWRGHALPACGTYPDGASLRRNRPGTRRIRGHRHR